MQSTPPTRIGRYEIVDRIGTGGMGVLYLARDPLLDRSLAIKVLSSDDSELRARFAREARSAASLTHPNIVTLYDIGQADGQPFIAMEYIEGETMADAIRRRAPLGLARKLQLMIDLCSGLGYAHRSGIIHRDVKPANLMIDADGVLKILDFGIARITNDAGATGLTRTGMMIGTPHYMSPEQVAGAAVDHRSDVFAVGLVCYELLSYRKAYGGTAPHEVIYRIMHTRPEPLADVCPGLEPQLCGIVEKAINKEPDDRYQDLEALAADLGRVRSELALPPTEIVTAAAEPTALEEAPEGDVRQPPPTPEPGRDEEPQEPQPASHEAPAPRAPQTSWARRSALGLAAAAVVVAAVVGGWWLAGRGAGPPPDDLQAGLDAAVRQFQIGRREEAIEGLRALAGDPQSRDRVEALLAGFRQTAASEAAGARRNASQAGVSETELAEADERLAAAEAENDPARAVGQFEEARMLYVRLAGTVASPVQLAEMARLALDRGDRSEAIELSVKALEKDSGLDDAAGILGTIRTRARDDARAARAAAADARAQTDPSFTVAEERLATANATNDPAQTARAVGLYVEAERLFRTAVSSVAPIDELMQQARDARRAGSVVEALKIASRIRERDPGHGQAGALVASVIDEAERRAMAARDAAVESPGAGSEAFRQAEVRLTDARTLSDPVGQFQAFRAAAVGFGEAASTPPPEDTGAAPPSDPAATMRGLLDNAEAELTAGRIEAAEKLVAEFDAEVLARGQPLPPPVASRRTGLIEAIGTAKVEAARRADLDGIQAALDEYRAAWEARDVDRLVAIAPALRPNRKVFEDSFKDMSRLTMELTLQPPDLDGTRATVELTEVRTQVTKQRGELDPITRQGQFVLVKDDASGRWVIEATNWR